MNKIAISGIAAVAAVGLGLFAVSSRAYAYGPGMGGNGQGLGFTQMLEQKAKIIKTTVTDLKTQLSQGKTFYQIATEKGISKESMQDQMETYQKARLQKMVDAGLITKAQMDERLTFMETRQKNCGNNTPQGGMSHFYNR
jgi:hypothetical protein